MAKCEPGALPVETTAANLSLSLAVTPDAVVVAAAVAENCEACSLVATTAAKPNVIPAPTPVVEHDFVRKCQLAVVTTAAIWAATPVAVVVAAAVVAAAAAVENFEACSLEATTAANP